MIRLKILTLVAVLPLLVGCASMMREFGANNQWEACHDQSCTLCSGTGQIACTQCSPQGETECANCHGTGMADIPVQTRCDQCQGSGHLYTASRRQVNCSTCNATGQKTVYEKKQCANCRGRGWAACPDCGGDKQQMHGRWVKVYEDGQRVPKPWVTAP